MTLDEAIRHAEEVASKCEFDTDWGMGNHFIDRSGVIECGKEHRQLAEWLRDYKRLLEYDDVKYHNEQGEVIVDKYLWEDARKVLEQTQLADGDTVASQMIVECDATDCKYCNEEFECTRKHLCIDVDCICGCWEEKIGEDNE